MALSRPQPQRLWWLLGLGGAVAVAGFAALTSSRVRRCLRVLWEGDRERAEARRKAAQREKRSAAAAAQQEAALAAVRAKLDTLEAKIGDCETMAAAVVASLAAAGSPASGAQQAMAGSPAPRGPTGLQSSYYHFSSDGRKLPSKWDSFNVDEELERLEAEEGKAEKSGASKVPKPREVRDALGGVAAALEAACASLDVVGAGKPPSKKGKKGAPPPLASAGDARRALVLRSEELHRRIEQALASLAPPPPTLAKDSSYAASLD